jgi:UDP-N-acetylmuramate dehydrogenase
MHNLDQFISHISHFEPKPNHPIAPFTTWGVGGPADVLVELDDSQKLPELVSLAAKNHVPIRILGRGANVLVPDAGIRGLVVINKSRTITILGNSQPVENSSESGHESLSWDNISFGKRDVVAPRHGESGNDMYSFDDLDFEETGEKVLVKFDSGVDVGYATSWTLNQGLTGLQWFAYIPSTMGGALYNNIHGGTHHLAEYFYQATVLSPIYDQDHVLTSYRLSTVGYNDMHFGYDQSILRENKDVIVVDVTLALHKPEDNKIVAKAKKTAQIWAKRKSIQPRQSAGCVFKNILTEDQKRLNLPVPSSGYITDKILNLKGYRVGNAEVAQGHASFIVNKGGATSTDIKQIIDHIKTQTKERLGIDLDPEINIL